MSFIAKWQWGVLTQLYRVCQYVYKITRGRLNIPDIHEAEGSIRLLYQPFYSPPLIVVYMKGKCVFHFPQKGVNIWQRGVLSLRWQRGEYTASGEYPQKVDPVQASQKSMYVKDQTN